MFQAIRTQRPGCLLVNLSVGHLLLRSDWLEWEPLEKLWPALLFEKKNLICWI